MESENLPLHRSRTVFAAALLLAAFCSATFLHASDFPDRAIKLIVPFSPGGGSDTAGRLLKRALGRDGTFPIPVVVVNVPGGGGTIGSRRVKNAAPDGHTILLLHEGIFTAHHSGQTTYGAEAFEPVAAFGSTGIVLALSEKSSLKTLPELVEHCRQNPDTLTFACNLGAPAHFIGLQLEKAAGEIRFRFVPSGGGAKRFGDLKGGEVEATIFSVTEFAAFEGGGIRPIAFLGSERHPEFKEIPTAIEQGVPLEASNIQFLWAPANTPEDVIAKIAGSVERALSHPETLAELATLHIDPVFLKGDGLDSEIETRGNAIASVATESPEIFPWFPHVIAGLCAALILWIAMRRPHGEKQASNPMAATSHSSPWRSATFVATALAYALVLALGSPFVLSTILFTFVSSCFLADLTKLGFPKLAAITLLAVALSFGCHFLFSRFLTIDLP